MTETVETRVNPRHGQSARDLSQTSQAFEMCSNARRAAAEEKWLEAALSGQDRRPWLTEARPNHSFRL